jgi:hypothetical protein
MMALRKIVITKQYAKIDGRMIDLFSASAICKVYDALSDANKEKFCSLTASKMADLAFTLMNKTK